jgi:hypothetical protein
MIIIDLLLNLLDRESRHKVRARRAHRRELRRLYRQFARGAI